MWTIRQTLDVHDDRGNIVATAVTPELAQRLVAMAAALEKAREALGAACSFIEDELNTRIDSCTLGGDILSLDDDDRPMVEDAEACLAKVDAALATIDGTEGRR